MFEKDTYTLSDAIANGSFLTEYQLKDFANRHQIDGHTVDELDFTPKNKINGVSIYTRNDIFDIYAKVYGKELANDEYFDANVTSEIVHNSEENKELGLTVDNFDKKYKLASSYKNKCGKTMYRIRALHDFDTVDGAHVAAGDYGGYVESEANLSQEGNCWIFGPENASKLNSKVIYEKSSKAFDNSVVADNAILKNNAILEDYAVVKDAAQVSASNIHNNAVVSDEAHVQDADIKSNAKIKGKAIVMSATIGENCIIENDVRISMRDKDDAVFTNSHIYDNACVTQDSYKKTNISFDKLTMSDSSVLNVDGFRYKDETLFMKCVTLKDFAKIDVSMFRLNGRYATFDTIMMQDNSQFNPCVECYSIDQGVMNNFSNLRFTGDVSISGRIKSIEDDILCFSEVSKYELAVEEQKSEPTPEPEVAQQAEPASEPTSEPAVDEKPASKEKAEIETEKPVDKASKSSGCMYINRISEKLIHTTKYPDTLRVSIPDKNSNTGYGSIFVKSSQVFTAFRTDGTPMVGFNNISLGKASREVKYTYVDENGNYQNKQLPVKDIVGMFNEDRKQYLTSNNPTPVAESDKTADKEPEV